MSKQSYSIPWFSLNRCNVTKNDILTRPEYIYDYMCYSILKMDDLSSREKVNQRSIYFDWIYSWKNILEGKALHIFLETKQLFDFLHTQEVKDVDISIDFAKKLNSEAYEGDVHELEDDSKKNVLFYATTVVIHHKYINKPSFVYQIKWYEENGKDKLASFYVEDEEGPLRLFTYDLEEANDPKARLLYNTIFYREAFPECIKDGKPEEIKCFTKYHKAINRIKLIPHESLLDHSGVTPHFRSGFFRRLQSEFYTKKRGQVIFVKSTFVKGRAETVLDSQEARTEMEYSHGR